MEKNGKVYDFQPLKDAQLRSFIEKRFRSAGKSYTSSVINLIMSESGYGNKSIEYSLYNLENDVPVLYLSRNTSDIRREW